MWVEDLTKAFWMLNQTPWKCLVWKVEDGFIYMNARDVRFSVKDLVEEYDKEYGVKGN